MQISCFGLVYKNGKIPSFNHTFFIAALLRLPRFLTDYCHQTCSSFTLHGHFSFTSKSPGFYHRQKSWALTLCDAIHPSFT